MNQPGRLGSLRTAPDLSLVRRNIQGQTSTSRPKGIFTPNIPERKKAKFVFNISSL